MDSSIIEDKKFCPKCSVHKPVSQFGKHTRNKDGLRRTCKECTRNEVNASRRLQKIRNESAITPKIEKTKKKIQSSNDCDEISKLTTKLANLYKFKKIEDESTPHNTLNLSYMVIFGDKQYDRNHKEFEQKLKLKFAMALTNAQVNFMNSDDIRLIPLKSRCIAVVHGIHTLTDSKKQDIARQIGSY